jgi:hypothetical protein
LSELDDISPAAVAPQLVPPVPTVLSFMPLPETVAFNRGELQTILRLYGRMVAAGEWRDYAIDHLRERAVFSVFRRTSESPLYRIEKAPKLALKQGQYSVVAQGGLILKRGADLERVLAVLEKRPKLVDV